MTKEQQINIINAIDDFEKAKAKIEKLHNVELVCIIDRLGLAKLTSDFINNPTIGSAKLQTIAVPKEKANEPERHPQDSGGGGEVVPPVQPPLEQEKDEGEAAASEAEAGNAEGEAQAASEAEATAEG
jgi:hypothetical protein